MVNMDIVLDVRNVKRQLSPQVFSMFLDRLRRLKKVFLFEEIPTEEYLLSMSDLETDILNDIWALMPSAVVRASSIPYEVVSDPMAFLPAYCILSRLFEHHGYPQFSAIPLRRSLAQSHVRIGYGYLASSYPTNNNSGGGKQGG
jgi:hypothetical protein